MKITIIGPAYPYRGGIAKFNELLAQQFIRDGHSVDIVNFTLQYPSILFPGKTQYTTSAAPDGYPIERTINSINPLSWFRAARKIRNHNPDLVIIRYWMPFFAPALGTIARRVKCPVIALSDNIIPHESHFYDKICTSYFLKSTNGVVYMSHQVGSDLEAFRYNGLKAFSPHPIYDTYGTAKDRTQACHDLGLDPNQRYSLFFGFIREYKGLDLLLQAWNKLPNQDMKLIVAGEYYGNKAKYDELIANLHLEDRVIIRDQYIPDTEVANYFSITDMVIQPYRTATQSGVTQIAYHFGVPMIVTNVGGLSEIVPNEVVGYVVEQSAEELRDAILKLSTPKCQSEFRKNIETEKNRFEWSKMTETFINLLAELKQ